MHAGPARGPSPASASRASRRARISVLPVPGGAEHQQRALAVPDRPRCASVSRSLLCGRLARNATGWIRLLGWGARQCRSMASVALAWQGRQRRHPDAPLPSTPTGSASAGAPSRPSGAIFDDVEGSTQRTDYDGVGEGGDHALVIDRRCEDAVFAELDGARATRAPPSSPISEERGEVAFGEGGEVRVVIDPIDGSLNARRTISLHQPQLRRRRAARRMADVEFGYVYDFGAGEEFVARRGAGATLDGEPHRGPPRTRARSSSSGSRRRSRSWRCRLSRRCRARSTGCASIGSIAITALPTSPPAGSTACSACGPAARSTPRRRS